MPVTKVEAPDGSIIAVEHPEGASEQAILGFAQREFQNRQFAANLPKPLEPKVNPVPQGGTIADSLGQGVFFGFGDELAGVAGATANTIANLFGKGTGDSFGEAYRDIRDIARERERAFSARNPGTALAAEVGGGLLTGGIGAARAGAFSAARNAPTLLGRIRPAVQTGAVQGGLIGAGASEGNARDVAVDTLKGAAIGGATAPVLPALAGGVKNAAGRIFQTQTDSPAFKEAVKLLKDKAGIQTLTTGQATGSRPLRSVETTVSETVFGSAIGNRLEQNRKKFQSAVLKMAGFDPQDVQTGEISTSAIERASKRFSDRYTKLLEGRTVDLSTDSFLDDLAGVEGRHLQFLPFEQRRQIRDIVDQFIDVATNKPLSGTEYQRIRSSLGLLERQSANNPKIAALYRDLKQALDDAFAAQSGAGAEKKIIDREYNRFAKLRDAFESSGSIQTSSGDIPLSMTIRRTSKRGKGTDKEFNDLLRAGQTVLGDPIANSGTPSRIANLLFLGQGLGSASLGGLDAGLMSIGLPVGASQALSRGVTGSGLANRVSDAGLLAAPFLLPFFANPEQQVGPTSP